MYPSSRKTRCIKRWSMAHGAEWWAVRKKDESRLHVAEMRMLRWIRVKTRKDHVRNQIIQENAKVCQMLTFLGQKRFDWYGHIRRREEDNLSGIMMDMVLPGNRRRGRPRRRWIDNTREDMKHMRWQLAWLKTDSTGKWWWKLAHKDVEMVSKGERWENQVITNQPRWYVVAACGQSSAVLYDIIVCTTLLQATSDCHLSRISALVCRVAETESVIVSIRHWGCVITRVSSCFGVCNLGELH